MRQLLTISPQAGHRDQDGLTCPAEITGDFGRNAMSFPTEYLTKRRVRSQSGSNRKIAYEENLLRGGPLLSATRSIAIALLLGRACSLAAVVKQDSG